MSTPNFMSMKDFPLIVAANEYIKVCPECGAGQDAKNDKCEVCDSDLSDVESIYDDFANEDIVRNMESKAKELNERLTFYTVSVESGHYSGVQFFVDEKYWKIEEMDNAESQEEFGLCRSKMLRKYNSESNFIRRELQKAKKELGLMELGVVAHFSNGETMYT